MGATTLYHPVPLSVLRGCVEYCGWRFGRIVQQFADEERGFASYTAHIVHMPEGMGVFPVGVIMRQLKHCFAADIDCTHLWFTKDEHWYCRLQVHRADQVARDEGKEEDR